MKLRGRDESLPERALSYPEAMIYDDSNQDFRLIVSQIPQIRSKFVVLILGWKFGELDDILEVGSIRVRSASSAKCIRTSGTQLAQG